MKDFNLLNDPENVPEKQPTETEPELTPDNFDDLVQTRAEPAETENVSAEITIPEAPDDTTEEKTVSDETDSEIPDFDDSINKKRLFLILGIVVGLIIGGVLLFVVLSGSEETPQDSATPPVAESATAETAAQAESPTLDPAFARLFAQNQAYNATINRIAGGIFTLKAGSAAPAMVVSEGKNLIITIKASSMDDAARFRMILKDKFPGLTIASMGKSMSRQGAVGYWDLVVPITVGGGAPGDMPKEALMDPGAFQGRLQQLLRQNSLQVVKLQKGPVVRNGTVGKAHVFYVEIRGSINRIMAFLNQMTRDFPAARIHKVRVGYPNFNVKSPRAEAEIDLYLVTE